MSQNEKINAGKEKPLLLYAPLDWGLGHTTRSIPIIKELLLENCEVIICCNSTQKKIFSSAFPRIRFLELEGYNISYGSSPTLTRLKTLLQVWKILIKIKSENRVLATFLKENQVAGVISDNRYGFYHPSLPCVFITHQLHVHTGFGRMADKWVGHFLYRFIHRFSVCWVPDFKQNGLAGKLSHPPVMPRIPVRYLGAVSRFNTCGEEATDNPLLVLLSGPEPQRTIFEQKIFRQLKAERRRAIVVRGLPGETSLPPAISQVEIINYADAEMLNELICRSEWIICRPGYTSVMDLLKLKKKMVTVPTPGQPEQEYLAQHLTQEGYAPHILQREFSLLQAEQYFKQFKYSNAVQGGMDDYRQVITSFVQQLIS